MRQGASNASKQPVPASGSAPPLAIYSDRKYLAPEAATHVPMLAPFWGPPSSPAAHPDAAMYDEFARTGQSVLRLVSAEDAEAFVLPHAWIRLGAPNPEARRMAEDARRAGKPLIVFFLDDSEETIPLDGSVIFRTSLRRSKRKANEHALSAPGEDLLHVYCGGEIPLRVKSEKPVVGFCGQAPTREEYRRTRSKALVYTIRSLWRPKQYGPWLASDYGRRIRMDAMESLQASPRVTTNFVLRQGFMNGLDYHDASQQEVARRTRREYVENLLGSDYILCPRGTGNFSYRFYETLCCGRIPIVIDTEIALPYEEWIDWRKHCVWVPEADVRRTADYVADFHARLTPEAFQEMQRAARALWVDWLSPAGFHANLYRYLR